MQIFLAYAFLGLGLMAPPLVNLYLIRHWLAHWWERRTVRLVLLIAWLACAIIFLLLLAGAFLHVDLSRTILGVAMVLAWLPQVALLISLPLVVLWLKVGRRLLRRVEADPPTQVDLRRRWFLKGSGTLLPLFAVGSSVTGVTATMGGARSFLEKLSLPGLPPALRGLRILHLSDVHLGGFMITEFLAQTLDNARAYSPDLIVITGDLVDDYRVLPEGLKLLENFKAPLGVYAVPGNHEYGNGIKKFHHLMGASQVHLLVNSGHRIAIGTASLYLAGMDDVAGKPRRLDREQYLDLSLKLALQGKREADFPILLSHRPQAFPLAARQRIPLTLAGHTHGGQAALAGYSWLQLVGAEDYSWGFYRKGDSLLYTTSGAGQWFPVRLGCPSEAPVFELG